MKMFIHKNPLVFFQWQFGKNVPLHSIRYLCALFSSNDIFVQVNIFKRRRVNLKQCLCFKKYFWSYICQYKYGTL